MKSAELANRWKRGKLVQVVLKGDRQAAGRYRRFLGLATDSVSKGGLKNWVARDLEKWFDRVEKMA